MDIKQFLVDYKDILLEEHKKEIEHYYKFLKPYINRKKVTSKFGEHYISCPWARDTTTCGPDTCECYNVEQYRGKMLSLIGLYRRIRISSYTLCSKSGEII